ITVGFLIILPRCQSLLSLYRLWKGFCLRQSRDSGAVLSACFARIFSGFVLVPRRIRFSADFSSKKHLTSPQFSVILCATRLPMKGDANRCLRTVTFAFNRLRGSSIRYSVSPLIANGRRAFAVRCQHREKRPRVFFRRFRRRHFHTDE